MTDCHTNTAMAPLSACHKAPKSKLPIQADLSWSPLPLVPLCNATFSFFFSRYYIPVKKSQEARYNLDPGSFFENRFWDRRPDGVAINEALQIVHILEFKLSTDRDEGFLEVKDAEANEQHKSIIGALKAAAPKWKFEKINLWWVTADRLLKANSTPSSKSLMYKKEKKTSSSPIM